jgi:C1A family cysteine protease
MAKKLHVHKSLSKGYGWRRPLLPRRRPMMSPLFDGTLPSSVDLRPNCPPVYDQGDLGSCTANAFGGLAEFLYMKGGQTGYVPSRLFIYYNERAIEGTISTDSGASLSDGANVLATQGCPHESLWWYNTAKFAVKPNKKVFADGMSHLVSGVAGVNQNAADMKGILATGNPIAIGFTVYDSFESDAVAATGIVPMPNESTEQVLGGHAVLVVGYDDSKNWWIVRNSWGASWGAAGYFYMPYQYLLDPNLSDDFWTAVSVA